MIWYNIQLSIDWHFQVDKKLGTYTYLLYLSDFIVSFYKLFGKINNVIKDPLIDLHSSSLQVPNIGELAYCLQYFVLHCLALFDHKLKSKRDSSCQFSVWMHLNFGSLFYCEE